MPIDILVAEEFDLDRTHSLHEPAFKLEAASEEVTAPPPVESLNERLRSELSPETLAEFRPDRLTIRSDLHKQPEDQDLPPPLTTSIQVGLEFDPQRNSIDPDDQDLLDGGLIRESEDDRDDGRGGGKGQIIRSSWNLGLVIAKSSICRGVAWCNLRQAVVWTHGAPDWVTPGTRITNGQIVQIGNLISRFFEMTWPTRTIDQQIEAAAKLTVLEPVQDWLREGFAAYLNSGREIPDPSDWLIKYCGAEDNEVNRMIGRWWLISVVARSMRPGTKVDHMLVLQGPQASRKTSLVYALMPRKDWVCELTSNIDTTDGVRQLDGRVLAFDDELKKTRTKRKGNGEENDIKSYLTREQDQIRTMYSPRFETTKRRVTFIGSCNNDEFLSDPTGDRRYWPVRITKCDDRSIARDRDALWAGAFALWLLGERFWPEEQAEIELLKERADDATERNPWASQYLWQANELFRQSNGLGVEIREIYEAFKGEFGRGQAGSEISQRETREIGDVLRVAGWYKERRMTGSIRRVYWLPRIE